MRERKLIAIVVLCSAVIAVVLLFPQLSSAQNGGFGLKKGDPDTPPPPYNPYPSGILPADVSSEIARVLREVDFIESEALAQLRALTPPTLTNQPPLLAHTGQRLNVLVGKALNFDKNMSPFQDIACASLTYPMPCLWPADPVRQSDDDRVSRIIQVSSRQAEPAEIHLC